MEVMAAYTVHPRHVKLHERAIALRREPEGQKTIDA